MKINEIFDKKFLEENMMGPCSPVILEELLEQVEMRHGMRVLDLGCGRGLTSVSCAFLHGQGISPSAEGDKGCSPLTSVAFLKKSDAKNFNMCVV